MLITKEDYDNQVLKMKGKFANPSVETDEYVMKLDMHWARKVKTETCPDCEGYGQYKGRRLCNLDGTPDECLECHGTGIKTVDPKNQPPVVDPELIEHMRRAFHDFKHGVAVSKEQAVIDNALREHWEKEGYNNGLEAAARESQLWAVLASSQIGDDASDTIINLAKAILRKMR